MYPMLKIRNFDVAAGHGYIDFAGIKDLDSEPLSFPKRHKENVVFGCQIKRAWTGYIDFFFRFEINVSLGQGYIENSTA